MSADERREDASEPTTADRAELSRIDERELRSRLLEALDEFLELDVAVHLVAVKGRKAIEYRIVLYPDGADKIEISKIQALADEYRLDFTMDRDTLSQRATDAGGLDGGWIIVLYPRW
jgi:hypothetical protein